MTDAHFLETPQPPPPKHCWKKKLIGFLLILVVILAAVIAIALAPSLRHQENAGAPQDIVSMQQRLTDLESQVRALNSEVSDLSNKPVTAAASSDSAQPSPASGASAPDTTRTQSDMVALSSALTALQAEVKQTGTHAMETQAQAEASLAAAMSFIELREAALSGQGFSTELGGMHEATKGDPSFQEALSKLEPLAAKGAPTLSTLLSELQLAEAPASQAVERVNAETWWQKLVAEFKGLVSIRKQHGGDTDAFAVMEKDLAKGDLNAAVLSFKSLPLEAQQSLSDWRNDAEARQKINDALHAVSDHFTTLATPPAAAPAPSPAVVPAPPVPLPSDKQGEP